jgi:hypothetical protein
MGAQRVLSALVRLAQARSRTPLMYSAAWGHPSIVQKLLGAGADPTLKDDVRAATRHRSVGGAVGGVWWGRPGPASAQSPRTTPAAASDASPTPARQEGETALDMAKLENHEQCIQIFEDFERDQGRRTCIQLAVVHFWRHATMRGQYDVTATTIGGRPGGEGLRRGAAEGERAAKMARTS